ncbi:hypothetical protein SKAU_G00085750 [Synaphobranchus kaupii]|uniref:Uncharacterized protein n=1 Tax=Synaphobranchus kaupii TaxID=118154 RepID=A0A9Q1FVW0_SYNKA|nr:hypothetical protein SKAU_G00085750 [Synaphobranchus kaupii]
MTAPSLTHGHVLTTPVKATEEVGQREAHQTTAQMIWERIPIDVPEPAVAAFARPGSASLIKTLHASRAAGRGAIGLTHYRRARGSERAGAPRTRRPDRRSRGPSRRHIASPCDWGTRARGTREKSLPHTPSPETAVCHTLPSTQTLTAQARSETSPQERETDRQKQALVIYSPSLSLHLIQRRTAAAAGANLRSTIARPPTPDSGDNGCRRSRDQTLP